MSEEKPEDEVKKLRAEQKELRCAFNRMQELLDALEKKAPPAADAPKGPKP